MDTRSIGNLAVTVVGVGCNNFGGRIDADQTAAVVHAALEAGITFFDTADIYSQGKSEELLGRVLGKRRGDVVIATKFGKPMQGQGEGAHPDYIRTAAEASLRRLGTDYIDLYQIHSPDPNVPIAETLGALNDLVAAGTVREIGCSNFSVEQIDTADAMRVGDAARFVSVQNEYSLLHREPEEEGVLSACARLGMAFLPYFPLARGLLTGKYRRGQEDPQGTRLSGKVNQDDLATVERMIQFAEARGHTILELAFSWLLMRPEVASVIAGATKPEQIKANVAATGWELTDEEMAELDEIAVS